MAFALRLDRGMQANLRRICDRQLRKALSELSIEPSDPRLADHVHQVRKRMKMLRGLLRLMRDVMPSDMYRQENAALRDAARALAGLRDTQVRIETFDRLVPPDTLATSALHLAPVRQALVTARDRRLTATPHPEEGEAATLTQLGAARAELEAMHERLPGWRLKGKGFTAVAGGLENVYARGRKAYTQAYTKSYAQAYASGDDRLFHEWRKQVKYHWYHVRLLESLWPVAMRARARSLEALGDRLGEDHDLTVLRAELPRLEGVGAEALAELEWRAARRQIALRDEARRLGGLLHAESPKAFRRRYRRLFLAGGDVLSDAIGLVTRREMDAENDGGMLW
ncbi:CHAD domain-containing protein [Halomonas sp. YLGW01]|uniref:CHAD domain-containing protein n=1 Tax=Halomonas sp. YLGW01 TaxID=2773308 RepID=UPI001787659D|nr:CHAD domain-containing protein [Halomonas sp. YLGW01]